MRAETAASIIEYFPGSSWAKPESKRHAEAGKVLAEQTHEDIVQACKTLRANLARTHCTAEEIVGEIKRNQRKAAIHARAWADGINPEEVERDLADMRRTLLLCSREELATGVAYARKVGALTGEPLKGKVEEWSAYQTGIVWAALDRKGVFA
jgi:hypothetical protein